MRKSIISVATALLLAGGLSTAAKAAEEVKIPFGAFWVQTGVFKSFGVNSKAVYLAFVEELHAKGGIKLKDGRIGKITTKFYDSGCKAEEALAGRQAVPPGQEEREVESYPSEGKPEVVGGGLQDALEAGIGGFFSQALIILFQGVDALLALPVLCPRPAHRLGSDERSGVVLQAVERGPVVVGEGEGVGRQRGGSLRAFLRS